MRKNKKKLTAAGLLLGALLLVGCGNSGSMKMSDERSASRVDLSEPATQGYYPVALENEEATTVKRDTDYLTLEEYLGQ